MASSLTARQGLFAVGLTTTAGFVDGAAFIHLGGYFVSFMSGNSTRAGADLAEGNLAGWFTAMGLVASFVVGVVISSLVSRRSKRRTSAEPERTTVVPPSASAVWTSAVLLMIATLVGVNTDIGWGPWLVAASMGAVNGTFTRSGEVTVGLTYMTGTLVKTGQHLAGALVGESRTRWLRYLALWAAIAVGSLAGAVAYQQWELHSLWFASAAMSILAVLLSLRLLGRRRSSRR